MPRIRKKTSKRGTTNHSARIKQKARETRKKNKRDAKKNPQWKSKHKKDPGIPQSFPFKGDVIAEIVAGRKKNEEEKLRPKNVVAPVDSVPTLEGDEDEDMDEPPVVLKQSSHPRGKGKEREATPENEPEIVAGAFDNLRSLLESVDVVIEVLDARDPLPCRSRHIEELIKEKGNAKLMLVITKIDTCPRENVQAWAQSQREHFPTFLFRAASRFLPEANPSSSGAKRPKTSVHDALGTKAIQDALIREANSKNGKALLVAVVGVTNTGKSSLVNSLLGHDTFPVYVPSSSSKAPSTTPVALGAITQFDGKAIHLIDTPGLLWQAGEEEEEGGAPAIKTRDFLLRNKGRVDKLKFPMPAVSHIVSRADNKDLMLFYNLPALVKGDVDGFLSALARSNGILGKRGRLYTDPAARLLLRDWGLNKFPYYTEPPSTTGNNPTPQQDWKELYAQDDETLKSIPTRKERRLGKGLIKMTTSTLETREPVLDEPWDYSEDEDSEEEGEDDEGDFSGMDDGDEIAEGDEDVKEMSVDGDDDDEDDEPVTKAPSPKKKVAFAPSKKRPAPKPSASKISKDVPPPKKLKPSAASAPKDGEEAYNFSQYF